MFTVHHLMCCSFPNEKAKHLEGSDFAGLQKRISQQIEHFDGLNARGAAATKKGGRGSDVGKGWLVSSHAREGDPGGTGGRDFAIFEDGDQGGENRESRISFSW